MNKIIVHGDIVELEKINKSLIISEPNKLDMFDIKKINIKVIANTNLIIEYNNEEETKLDINIEVDKNVSFDLVEIVQENKLKIRYKFNLNENSNTVINKLNDCDNVKELTIINLNGKNANVSYNFKTICKEKQKYDLMIYHNYKNTISNINNKGVNILNGNLTFNVTGIVNNGIKNCILNQNNRIINMNDKKCTINPNLLIDDNDVEANHSALIGKFSDAELFYLQSRGIDKERALNLLVKGFLLEGIKDKQEIEKIIDKYWR